jgi:hypothetical protein
MKDSGTPMKESGDFVKESGDKMRYSGRYCEVFGAHAGALLPLSAWEGQRGIANMQNLAGLKQAAGLSKAGLAVSRSCTTG